MLYEFVGHAEVSDVPVSHLTPHANSASAYALTYQAFLSLQALKSSRHVNMWQSVSVFTICHSVQCLTCGDAGMRIVGKRLFEDVTICGNLWLHCIVCWENILQSICVCFLCPVAFVVNTVGAYKVWYFEIRFVYT